MNDHHVIACTDSTEEKGEEYEYLFKIHFVKETGKIPSIKDIE